MIFCNECFRDRQVRAIIESNASTSGRSKGVCPICSKKSVFLYDTDQDSVLTDFFNDLISIYTPVSLMPAGYSPADVHMIADELKNEWNIFSESVESGKIYEIVKALSPALYTDSHELFDSPVGIPEKYDSIYLENHSILSSNKWEDFVNSIKHENRFHTKYINHEKLSTYLSYLRKDYKSGISMFRGRLRYTDKKFKPKEMGAPPSSYAREGRANSAGISRLYLADSEQTCIHEIRSGAFDVIDIGRFRLQEDISVIDFKLISQFSPFNDDFDFLEYLINKPILKKIDQEMGRALRSSDDPLDYVPTQYLCDFIKTLEYEKGKSFEGVEYSSTLNKGGYNLAVFYPNLFKCTVVKTHKIQKLSYDHAIIK